MNHCIKCRYCEIGPLNCTHPECADIVDGKAIYCRTARAGACGQEGKYFVARTPAETLEKALAEAEKVAPSSVNAYISTPWGDEKFTLGPSAKRITADEVSKESLANKEYWDKRQAKHAVSAGDESPPVIVSRNETLVERPTAGEVDGSAKP